jgi:hypothetical protein
MAIGGPAKVRKQNAKETFSGCSRRRAKGPLLLQYARFVHRISYRRPGFADGYW